MGAPLVKVTASQRLSRRQAAGVGPFVLKQLGGRAAIMDAFQSAAVLSHYRIHTVGRQRGPKKAIAAMGDLARCGRPSAGVTNNS